MQNVNPNTD